MNNNYKTKTGFLKLITKYFKSQPFYISSCLFFQNKDGCLITLSSRFYILSYWMTFTHIYTLRISTNSFFWDANRSTCVQSKHGDDGSSHLCAGKEVRVSLDPCDDLTQDYTVGEHVGLKTDRHWFIIKGETFVDIP